MQIQFVNHLTNSRMNQIKSEKKGLMPIDYLALVVRSEDKVIETRELRISNIESLYNIQNIWKKNKWEVFTTVFSDFDKLIPIGGVFDENPLQTS
jgi:hypothetical protein